MGTEKPIRSSDFRRRLATLALLSCLAGCQGKTLVDDNPVFAQAPPRGALTNRSSTLSNDADPSVIRRVSESSSMEILKGNSVVAEVNGSPIFVDDLIGGVRLALDEEPNMPIDQKQKIMYGQIRQKIEPYIEQEIVLQALNAAVPADRQALIDESLEEPFQEIIKGIKAKNNVTTDAELNEVLAGEGVSISLLREAFVRIQKVQGYLGTFVTSARQVDRPEIVDYYQNHKDDFTSEERVRLQEIVLYFDSHGGDAETGRELENIIRQMNQGASFADLAAEHSDAPSAEKRGDIGWLVPGSLTDKDLEQRLYQMNSGEITDVVVQDNRLELYRVSEHQYAQTQSLQDVQLQIEEILKKQKAQDIRKATLEKLREKATVVFMFDHEDTADNSEPAFGMPRF